ncbi:Cof-type HAD-IIB family hydrolase [Vibrio aphrogenes]|uniref:Cof-type HAD-IIB family hydrolase n=1 Tax=Vibrio aphrogenes TaxID=1891186 RepID=UPI000B354827|nr:Cof-type HAD-IIB family hydrolase [Vibrio aphrogenes]
MSNSSLFAQTDLQDVRIVASDLDGTLLLPDHTLGELTKNTLKKLHDQGMTFIFATGRHHIDVESFRASAGIPAYMITSNGARVHSPENELLYSKNLPENVIQPIVDIIKHDPTHRIHIYRSNDWLTDKEDLKLSQHHQESGFNYALFDVDNAPTEDIAKLFFTHPDHDHLAEYEQQLKEKFGDQISIAFSTPWCLEMMAPHVSKGDALQAVAHKLGKDLEHCIAFGDGMNDVEMLQAAHKGLVMGTAHSKVMQALPNNEVIGCCADEAVARYLEDHLL